MNSQKRLMSLVSFGTEEKESQINDHKIAAKIFMENDMNEEKYYILDELLNDLGEDKEDVFKSTKTGNFMGEDMKGLGQDIEKVKKDEAVVKKIEQT